MRGRKEIQEETAEDFTSRLIAESGQSGVTWSLGPDDIRHQTYKVQQNPKGVGGHSRFKELEPEFHATRQQASDAQHGAPSELPVICPNCGDLLPHEYALRLYSWKGWLQILPRESARSAKRRAAPATCPARLGLVQAVVLPERPATRVL